MLLHAFNLKCVITYQFAWSIQFSSGLWSPQWAEGICWGASGTKWQRCMAWHNWDTWSSQDHQLVRRIMSKCDWTLPCCLVARHPDRQNCRCDWHHQPSLLLEFGDDHVFSGQLVKTWLRGRWVHHDVPHDQPSRVYAAGRVEPLTWELSNVSNVEYYKHYTTFSYGMPIDGNITVYCELFAFYTTKPHIQCL